MSVNIHNKRIHEPDYFRENYMLSEPIDIYNIKLVITQGREIQNRQFQNSNLVELFGILKSVTLIKIACKNYV